MLHYKRPYLSPENTDLLAEAFAHAHPLFPLASGVRPNQRRHRAVLRHNLDELLTEQQAYGNPYLMVRATHLHRRLREALAESALNPPGNGDYARLVDNALHNLPEGCEVRYTRHSKAPHNKAPKSYIFKMEPRRN